MEFFCNKISHQYLICIFLQCIMWAWLVSYFNNSRQIVRAGIIFANIFGELLPSTDSPSLAEPSLLVENSGRL